MTKYRITYRTEVVIDVPDGVDLGPLDEERKINDYDLRTEPKLIREFEPTDPVIHLTGKIETFEGWYTVSADTPTDAATEAELGRELIAELERIVAFLDGLPEQEATLLAIQMMFEGYSMNNARALLKRARALRDSNAD